jgi:hypothetical protein
MASSHSHHTRSLAATATSSSEPQPLLLAASGCVGDGNDTGCTSGGGTALVTLCRLVPMTSLPTSLVPTRASGAGSNFWAQALQSLSADDCAKLLYRLNNIPSTSILVQEQSSSLTLLDLLEQLCHVAER